MIYLDYEKKRQEYQKSYAVLSELIEEKERLFQRTQPQATKYDREKVTASGKVYSYIDYIADKEDKQLENRIEQARKVFSAVGLELAKLLKELRRGSVQDKVYYLRHCRCMEVERIAYEMEYSESHIYRILEEIQRNIDNAG